MSDVKFSKRILFLGHINLDIIARDVKRFSRKSRAFAKASLHTQIGGSIAHLGPASEIAGLHRTAVCCVSSDYVGEILKSFVEDSYDASIVLEKSPKNASVIPIVYRGTGLREVISPDVSANDMLTKEDIESPDVLQAIQQADIVYVDGYSAVESGARIACRHLLEIARATGAITVLDVVPHHAYEHYSWSELKQLARNVDIIILETKTLSGFVGDDFDLECDAAVDYFRRSFPNSLGILRYGDCNIRLNRFASDLIDVVQELKNPNSELRSTGFGDRLTMGQLDALFTNPSVLGIEYQQVPWAR